MLKIDDGDIQIEGTAKEILMEWSELTAKICEALQNELETEVGINQLIEGSIMYLKNKEKDKLSKNYQ